MPWKKPTTRAKGSFMPISFRRRRLIALLIALVLGPARVSAQEKTVSRQDGSETGSATVPSPERVKADFERMFLAADGPASLAALYSVCEKAGHAEGKERVRKVLEKMNGTSKPGSLAQPREKARAERSQARRAVENYREGQAKRAVDEIGKLVAWMKQERFAPSEAKGRLKDLISRMAVGEADRLTAELEAVEDASRSSEERKKLAKALDSRVSGLVRSSTERILAAVEKCLAAKEPGLAFDLFQYLLRLDPENERAHKGLGQVRLDGRWLRPFEAEVWRSGLVWDDRFGWILAKQKDRYDRGDYLDLEAKRWAPLTEWNRIHADAKNPWKLQSEHFDLVPTADLTLSVQVQKRLEAFFLQAFRQYDLFFAGLGAQRNAQLIFGVAPIQKRLTVFFYRDRDQFMASARPPVRWAAGFYSPEQHASFFHAVNGDVSVEILQHEVTHQILAEFSGGGDVPSWLAEGAAVFLQEAFFKDGILTVGGSGDRRTIRVYRENVRAGRKEPSLGDVLRFESAADGDGDDIAMNYRGAGALAYFLMTMDGGRYRGDYLEMLRDGYAGRLRPIEDYFGLSRAGLEFLMDRFYRECDR